MVVECMYCGIVIEVIGSSDGVSHGVCSDCLPEVLDEMEISLAEYLESMPFPAVLVSEHGRILAKNNQYRRQIKVDPHAIAVDMAFANPDEHVEDPSQDSAIIRIVQKSIETGQDSWEIRARADIGRPDDTGAVEVMMGAKRIGRNYIIGIEGLPHDHMS